MSNHSPGVGILCGAGPNMALSCSQIAVLSRSDISCSDLALRCLSSPVASLNWARHRLFLEPPSNSPYYLFASYWLDFWSPFYLQSFDAPSVDFYVVAFSGIAETVCVKVDRISLKRPNIHHSSVQVPSSGGQDDSLRHDSSYKTG